MRERPSGPDVVIRLMLARIARERPDEPVVTFEDGSSWSGREALEMAGCAAASLSSAGVGQDDRVAIFLPNGPDFIRAWWGACVLGAVITPINLAFRGTLLTNLLDLADPALIVVDDEHRERLDAVGSRLTRLHPDELSASGKCQLPQLDRGLEPRDICALITTSGTTGPSKLSCATYNQQYLMFSYLRDWGCGVGDVYLVDLPLFHLAAISLATFGLSSGGRLVVRSAPALNNYWEVARDCEATVAVAVSTMLSCLQSQEQRPAENEHRLRYLVGSPVPKDLDAFQERFGIEFVTQYGSTEVPCCLVRTKDDTPVPGYCGRVRPGFDCRIVDSYDVEVPPGEIGELLVRTDEAWWLSAGYVANPAATANAWRNGWFHTGDLFRRNDNGDHFFVDRAKDALRRRGENISSFEVEAEVASYPGVAEVACVPERSDTEAEDEVKVWIVPVDGATIDFRELLSYLVERMPHFMVPRYFELATELPKTPSARVKKYELRERGTSTQTWDREKHGLAVTRTGIVRLRGAC